MPLKLPDFRRTHCVSIVAGGMIESANAELLKWMKAEKPMIAACGSRSGKLFFRAHFGGNKAGNHLHIDVSKASFYSDKFKPPHVAAPEQVQKKLERFMGKGITTDLRGLFEIKLSELPEGGIIRSLFFKTQTGNVSIKVSGARFVITGAPINAISWQALPNEKIGVILESENLKTTVSEDYLTKTLSTLEEALNVFVLGKVPNAQK